MVRQIRCFYFSEAHIRRSSSLFGSLKNYITHNAPGTEGNMAAPEQSKEPDSSSIPDYELVDVNSKAFHVASFRDEWLSRLEPRDYSFNQVDEDAFDANFMKETGVSAETMKDLKSICR